MVGERKVKNIKRKVVGSLHDGTSFVGGRKQFHTFTLYTFNFTLCLALCILHSLSANAEAVRVADCERDAKLDFWAAADNEFCVAIMDDVFKFAGIETTRVEFGEDHLLDVSKADVICSAFRTKKLLQDFDFPQQPLGRMHFALYATPSRALARLAGADIERRPHEVLRACAALADVRGDSDERRRGAGAARR